MTLDTRSLDRVNRCLYDTILNDQILPPIPLTLISTLSLP